MGKGQMRKSILWMFVLLICLTTVSAWYTPLHYWPLDGNFADNVTANKSDMRITKGSPVSENNCIQGSCYFFEADAVSNMSVGVKNPSEIRTIELWHRINSTTGEDTFIDLSDGSTSISNELWCKRSTIQYQCRIDRGGAFVADQAANNNGVGWRHIVIQMVDSRVVLFEDGAILLNFSSGTDGFDGNFTNWTIGHSWAFAQPSNKGLIDNVAFFREVYSQDNITDAYNGGAGQNYSGGGGAGAPSPVSKEFNLSNIVNLTSINTFNITITNSSYSEKFNITNGSINVNLTNGVYNISIESLEHFDLFMQDFNVTDQDSWQFRTGQIKLTVNLTKIITKSQAINFTIINSNVSNSSTHSGGNDQLNIFVNKGQNNFKIDGFNFTGTSFNYTGANPQQNTSFQINVTNHQWTFLARDAFTGADIDNFSFTLINDTYSYLNEYALTTRNLTVDLENVTFDANVTHSDYVPLDTSIQFSGNTTEIVFLLTKALTINASILYEQSRLQILNNTNFTIEIIGDSYTNNFSVQANSSQNTTFRIEDVPAGNYEIRYDGGGFDHRSKFITLTTQSSVQTDLYALDETNSSTIPVTVTDEFGQEVEGAIVKALRYYLDINGYISVEEVKTNFLGNGEMNLEKDNVWYKFIVELNGNTLFESSPTEITQTLIDSGLNFQVLISGDIIKNYADYTDTVSNITFINTTSPNQFRLTFNNPDGLSKEVCLNVQKLSINGFERVNRTCTTASAGSLLIDINESDLTTYRASSEVRTLSASEFFVNKDLVINLVQNFKTFGVSGLFFAFMMFGTLAAAGAINPAISIVLGLVGLSASVLTGFMAGTWSMVVLLIIMGGIVFIRLRT